MLRSSTTQETAAMQGFRGVECRGEDSNLCRVAELDLQVGAPLRGSGLALPYSLAMFLVVATAVFPWLAAGLLFAAVLAWGWWRA